MKFTVLLSVLLISGPVIAKNQTFEAADRDQNGLVSLHELSFMVPFIMSDLFDLADADSNNKLSVSEFERYMTANRNLLKFSGA